MLRIASIATFGACLLFMSSRSFADQLNLEPAKDATLYEENDGSRANGSGQSLFVGAVGATGGGDARRALLYFDISSIPTGSIIHSATLKLTVTRTVDITPRQIGVHKVLQNWGEGASDPGGNEGIGTDSTAGDATWVHTFFNSQTWNEPGGDFDDTASAATSVGGDGDYVWTSADLIDDVRDWVERPSENYGWLLRGVENIMGTARRFASRENSTAANRPTLTIDYTPGADPSFPEELYFPQFGNGDGFFSQITLINTSATTDATGKIAVRDDAGNPFVGELNGQPLVNGEFEVMVPASGTRVYRTSAQGAVNQGSVVVFSDIPLDGVIVFGGAFGLAGVVDSDDTAVGFTGPVETLNPPEINTGLAVQNLESEAVALNLELVDEEGSVLATASLDLPANGHRALFVSDLAWTSPVDFSEFVGTVRATTNRSVAATMIQQRVVNGTVQFATLPVVQR